MVGINFTSVAANYTDWNGIEIAIPPPALSNTRKPVNRGHSTRRPYSPLGFNPAQAGFGFGFFALVSCTPVNPNEYPELSVGDPCRGDADCDEECVCRSYSSGTFCTRILSEGDNCGSRFIACDEGLSCYSYKGEHGLCLPFGQSTEGQWCNLDEQCQPSLTCSSSYGQNGVCIDPNPEKSPPESADAGTPTSPDAGSSEPPDSGPPDLPKIGPPMAPTLDITGVTLSAEEVEIPGYGPYVDTLSEVTGSMALTFIPESGTVVTGDVAAGGYSSLVGAVIYISAPPGEGLYEAPGGAFTLDTLASNASFSDPTTPTGRALVDGASDTFEMVVPVAFSTEDGALFGPPVTIVMSGESIVTEADFILASPWAVYAMSGATLRVDITGVINYE